MNQLKNVSMNRLIVLAFVLLGAITVNAQTDRAAQRKEQKRLEVIQDSLRHVAAVNALESQNFVLEADQLLFKRGRTAFVSSTTNFVSLSDGNAVVQIASYMGGGPNGIGGITVEGRASRIEIKTDKRGNTSFSMNVSGIGISASVRISLFKGSNEASVDISPNFHSNRLTLKGNVFPYEQSRIFKGSSL